ncbi:hypothetical protein [Pseudoalteromonas sp. McH1-42]|nr:hypothetical protein [Pseudoalteromonas sp. McH1-42]
MFQQNPAVTPACDPGTTQKPLNYRSNIPELKANRIKQTIDIVGE